MTDTLLRPPPTPAPVPIDRFEEVKEKLPLEVNALLDKFKLDDLTEIRLVTGYPLVLNFNGEMVRFDGRSELYRPFLLDAYQGATPESLAVEVTSDMVRKQVKPRLTGFADDNRTGVEKTLHRFSGIPNHKGTTVGIVIRLARAHMGSAQRLMQDFSNSPLEPIEVGKRIEHEVNLQNVLRDRFTSMGIVSRPALGKTTLLRDITRFSSLPVSEGGIGLDQLCVLIDSSNEVAGFGDLPHPAIGNALRIQVGDPASQAHKIKIAIRNLTCARLIVDEIGYNDDVEQILSCSNLGVGVFATLHGFHIGEAIANSIYKPLFGLNAASERVGKVAFQTFLELHDRDRWVLYPDLSSAVDEVVAGKNPRGIKVGPGWEA